MDRSHWEVERAEAVCQRAERFVRRIGASTDQTALLSTALNELRTASGGPIVGPRIISLLVYAALRGTDEPALDLAAALALLEVGIQVLDDLQDGDVPQHWAGYSPGEMTLAATGLIGVVPHLLLAELDAPPATIVAMHRSLSQSLVRIAEGQQRDLRLNRSRTATAEQVEASVVSKSGERPALFARLAAQLAGATDAQIDLYERFGREVGVAIQVRSDCLDIFGAGGESSDLANGTRTLPIALHLDRLEGAEREAFLARLEAARTSRDARLAVRRELLTAGVLMATAFTIEIHRQRALALLAEAEPREPGASRLRSLLDTLAMSDRSPLPATSA